MKSHTEISLFTTLHIVKINSVNPLYLMFSKMNVYFEKINENKHLTLVPTNESKEKTKKV